MTETLKPCPFCKDPGEICPTHTGYSVRYYVECSSGCCVRTSTFSTESEAVAAWDTRAPDDVAQIVDWWKPHPEDPFWMLEAEDGEWLKNAYSFLGTRDATKAIRFPTERDAINHPAKHKAGYKWWAAKATEHTWITIERGDWKDKNDATSD